MANDLEAAAHSAVLSIEPLRHSLREAQELCEDALDEVTTLSDRLETDRNALQQAVEELDKTVEESTKQLFDDVSAVEAALAEVATAAQNASNEGRQVLATESSALEDVADHLHAFEPQLAALAEAAAAAGRAALDRAEGIVEGLSQAVDAAEQLLSVEFAAVIADLGREIETATIAVVSVLEHQCPAILEEEEHGWVEKMGAVRQVVEKVFGDMQGHADEVVRYSVERFGLIKDRAMEVIATEARELESDMENLGRVASAHAAEIERKGAAVVDSLRTCETRADAVAEALHQIRGRWVLFGF